MKVKLRIKPIMIGKVKEGMHLGKHFVKFKAQEFDLCTEDQKLLKTEQFKFYMEKMPKNAQAEVAEESPVVTALNKEKEVETESNEEG